MTTCAYCNEQTEDIRTDFELKAGCPICCYKCVDKSNLDAENAERLARADRNFNRWASTCPLEYRTKEEGGRTIESRLDCAVIQASNGAETARHTLLFDWKGDDTGRWLSGETGGMKTRLAWRIVRDAWDRGKSVRTFTAWSWQSEFQDAAGRFEAAQWMNGVCLVDLVFVDDIGKLTWTENAGAAFFEMIERRSSTGKRILFTSNHSRADVGETAISRRSSASDGLSDPLARRLKEFCSAYLIGRPKPCVDGALQP